MRTGLPLERMTAAELQSFTSALTSPSLYAIIIAHSAGWAEGSVGFFAIYAVRSTWCLGEAYRQLAVLNEGGGRKHVKVRRAAPFNVPCRKGNSILMKSHVFIFHCVCLQNV